MPDRVAEFLSIGKPKAYCDPCLSEALGIEQAKTARITVALGLTKRYAKVRRGCAVCGVVQLVIIAV